METTTIRLALETQLTAAGLGPLPPAIVDNLTAAAENKMASVIAAHATREAILRAFRETAPQKVRAKKTSHPVSENKK